MIMQQLSSTNTSRPVGIQPSREIVNEFKVIEFVKENKNRDMTRIVQ
jgi:hypothetical protein